MTRRAFQALLALALCGVFAVTLGGLYVVFAVVASLLAVASGVYVSLALAAGLAWPVTALAYVLFTTRSVSARAAQLPSRRAGTPSTTTTETRDAGLLGVEDAKQRERRDQ
jgi:membrane protein implicated in regulation of membrane protease activity